MSILAGDRVYTAQDSIGLIACCLQGDEFAFAQLYRIYAGQVYRLVYGLLSHREDTEEVVQDTLVYAMRNLARYDPGRASFRTWLFTIAISRARNKRRRRRLPTVSLWRLHQCGLEAAQPADSDRPPEAAAEGAGVQRAVRLALNQLSPKLREAAVLRYFEGLTYREMGLIIGIPHKTAESRVRLAHRALRKLIGELE